MSDRAIPDSSRRDRCRLAASRRCPGLLTTTIFCALFLLPAGVISAHEDSLSTAGQTAGPEGLIEVSRHILLLVLGQGTERHDEKRQWRFISANTDSLTPRCRRLQLGNQASISAPLEAASSSSV